MKLNNLKLLLIKKIINLPVNRDIQRGFIIIQIDGLSSNNLKKAIDRKYMPKIKKHFLNGKFLIKSFYSGFPSNTPNFQKTIMFGDINPVPGFRWFNKYENKFHSFTYPETAELIEKRYDSGILKQGVSYYNLFSGGAKRAYITLSKIFNTNLTDRITGIKIFLLIFLNIFTIFKIIFKSIKELIHEIKDQLYLYFNDLPNRNILIFPFLRILNNVVIQEYLTHAVQLEIICGTPKIYVTFNAFDEISHQRGPHHRASLKVLKAIDKSIYRIFKLALNSKIRKYDFYLLSDHGQAPSLPFKNLFKRDLEFIIKRYNSVLNVSEQINHGYTHEDFNISILKKIKKLSFEGQIPKIFNRIIKDFKVNNIIPAEITVASFGPVSHLYFTEYSYKLDFNDINAKYPLFILELLSHRGVSFILLNDNTETLLLFKSGFLKIINSKIIKSDIRGKEQFAEKISGSQLLVRDLENFAKLKYSGDIIIFSNDIMDGLINFENQLSCHGGIGFGQTDSFIIYPFYRSNISKVKEPIDLYNFFKNSY